MLFLLRNLKGGWFGPWYLYEMVTHQFRSVAVFNLGLIYKNDLFSFNRVLPLYHNRIYHAFSIETKKENNIFSNVHQNATFSPLGPALIVTERFMYYRKYILRNTHPSQYRCTQLQYIFAVISEEPSNFLGIVPESNLLVHLLCSELPYNAAPWFGLD